MRIGVIGCAGRMGRAILREIIETEGPEVAGGAVREGNAALGQDLGLLAGTDRIGLSATLDLEDLIRSSDVLIEFSSPEASAEHAELCAQQQKAHVIGTTGLAKEHEAVLGKAANRIPLVWAANMSLGVNILLALVEQTAASLDEGWDIEILEMHHRHKVDAPSGTAVALGLVAAKGRGVDLDEASVRVRDGITGHRRLGSIGFASLRGGDVVGEHDVIFAAEGERVILSHKATDRRIFARGAVHAALWVAGRPPGLYGMADVLGLRRERSAP